MKLVLVYLNIRAYQHTLGRHKTDKDCVMEDMAWTASLQMWTLKFMLLLLDIHLGYCKTQSSNHNLSANDLFEEFLSNQSYNPNIRPHDKKTIVQVQIRINGISDVDQLSQDFTVEMMLRLFWTDPRLENDFGGRVVLSKEGVVWQPDIYFPNEKTSLLHNLISPNLVYFITGDGKVVHSRRLAVKLSCSMDIRAFPMDTQICSIRAESYAWNNEYLQLEWFDKGQEHFMDMESTVEVPAFHLADVWVDDCIETPYLSGTYSCVLARLKFERRFNLYFINTYIPSLFVVIMSWLTFWIDVKIIAARVSVGLLTVLTMSTQTSSILSSLPPVAYIKAMDIWMCACLVFVFAAFLETALVQVLDYHATLRHRTASTQTQVTLQNNNVKKEASSSNDLRTPTYLTASSLDGFCRVAFPVSCATFCGLYFLIYLTVLK